MKKDVHSKTYSLAAKALSKIGDRFQASFIGKVFTLLSKSLSTFGHDLNHHKLDYKQIVHQVYFTGFEALPLLLITSTLFGTVVVMQALTAMPKVGYGGFFGEVMVIVIIRELGPIFTAFLVAGRTGSGLSTFIGNMKVQSEIDALETLGIDPIRYLVMPAVVGCVVAMTCLTSIFNAMAIFAGFLCAKIYIVMFEIPITMDWTLFLDSIFSAMNLMDLALIILKPTLFGLLISGIACHCGLRLSNDSRTVPMAASSSVVYSFTYVIIANGLVTSIYLPQYLEGLGSFL